MTNPPSNFSVGFSFMLLITNQVKNTKLANNELPAIAVNTIATISNTLNVHESP